MTKRPSATASLAALALALASIPLLELLTGWFIRIGFAPGFIGQTTFLLAYQCLFFGGFAFIYYSRHADVRPAMRARLIDPLCAIVIILAALASMLSLNQFSVLWTQLLEHWGLAISNGADTVPRSTAQMWYMLVVASVAPALFEEILFRGFLLPSFEIKGEGVAILLNGVLFTLMHGRIESLPAHLLLGFALSLLVIRTGSVYASMLFHAVFNGSLVVASYLMAQADPASLERTTTLADSVENLPVTLGLMAISALLVHVAAQRGKKKQRHPLPPATRGSLPAMAKALLALCVLLMLFFEARALLAMLPGAGA